MPSKRSSKETETETETEDRGKKVNKKEEQYCPPSCFTLDPKEVDQLFKCLARIKVSSGYCGKISRYQDTKKKRFSGMKSHDYHVMMTQLLPVALRGLWTHMCVRRLLSYATFLMLSIESRSV